MEAPGSVWPSQPELPPTHQVSTPDLLELLLGPEAVDVDTAVTQHVLPSSPPFTIDTTIKKDTLNHVLQPTSSSDLAMSLPQRAGPADPYARGWKQANAGTSTTAGQPAFAQPWAVAGGFPPPLATHDDTPGQANLFTKRRFVTQESSPADVIQAQETTATTSMQPQHAAAPNQQMPHMTFTATDGPRQPKTSHHTRRPASRMHHKLEQLEKQLRLVSTEFDLLHMENTKLQHKLQICEVLLPLREQQISSAAGLATNISSSDQVDNRGNTAQSAHPACLPSRSQTDNTTAAAAASSSFATRLGSVTAARPTAASFPAEVATPMVADTVQQAFALGTAPGPLTDAEFRQVHLHYQKSVAHLVAAWNTFPTAAVAAQLMDLQVEFNRKIVVGVFAMNRQQYHRHLGVNLETGANDFPGDVFWTRVGQRVRPTPDELAQTKIAITMYDDSMKDVLSEREALAEKLSACLAAAGGEEGKLAEDLLQKMEANLMRESEARQAAMNYVGMTALTVPTYASMWAYSYPYFPDDIACMKAILQAHGT